MRLKEFLLSEIDREIDRSRRALEQVPADKYDWKPHEKSMIFGYLANMVATIPVWIAMQINQDELYIAPKDGGKIEQKRLDSSAELLEALDTTAAGAREAFDQTTDEHPRQQRVKAGGNVVCRGAPRNDQTHYFTGGTIGGHDCIWHGSSQGAGDLGPSADDKDFGKRQGEADKRARLKPTLAGGSGLGRWRTGIDNVDNAFTGSVE